MDSRAKQLTEQADYLFGKREQLMSFWQEVAENFYPERADFTTTRSLGDTFADNLTTSYPLLARRDLGNSFSGILRPTNKDWFRMGVDDPGIDRDSKIWLQWAGGVQKRAMYDRRSMFVRATKEGDHDFAAFGQCVISVELNPDGETLLYRCWHLRDVVWCEGVDGMVNTAHRKWKPTGVILRRMFRDKLSAELNQRIDKDPYTEINCMHSVIPSDQYEGSKKFSTPFVSAYTCREDDSILEEIGVKTFNYVIPRWQTVSGSQYAYSPATVCALPDARLIQSMTLSLLEAGEKAVNPPMIAKREIFKDDIAIFAGGITWADMQGDGNIGDNFQVLTNDKSGIPFGIEMSDRVQAMIKEAFYLNKLSLPIMAGDMTATEVSQRVQEYIRQAMPLFEPVESDYNGAICERTFDVMLSAGGFGPMDQLPAMLRGQDVKFRFESPLTEAVEKRRGQVFLEGAQLLGQAVALDPSCAYVVDAPAALRDALEGIGMEPAWLRSAEMVDAMQQKAAQDNQQAQLLQTLQAGADVAKTANEAMA